VRKDYSAPALVLTVLVILGYALFSHQAERSKTDKESVASIQAETNPDAVLPKILSELDARIRVKDGFVFVTEEPGPDTFLLPVSSPWVVQFGVGASIQLGTVASGADGAVGSQVDVALFSNVIDKSACAIIAPRIATRLQEKLAGK